MRRFDLGATTLQASVPLVIAGYWGKAQPRDCDQAAKWHPLAYHSLDVAACGAALLRARPGLLRALARLSGLSEATARDWLLVALALHDIGKFAECFQIKSQCIRSETATRDRLSGQLSEDPGHGSVGAAVWSELTDTEERFWQDLLSRLPSGDAYEILHSWVAAAFGHHGRPVGCANGLDNLISDASRADAQAFVVACLELLPVAGLPLPAKVCARSAKQASWLVAGIVMLADWIGSRQEGWFEYHAPTLALDDYWAEAQRRAGRAVAAAGVSRPQVAASFTLSDALAELTDAHHAATASPLQSWVIESFAPRGQTLLVIEDLTGSGKTEAALMAAHRLMRNGSAGGLYWALPTMATANGLYARLRQSYRRLFADPALVSLVLAHGKSRFNDDFRRSVLPAERMERATSDADGITASAQCAAWIADDRRKTFLADVGIGTVDQALLSVLPVKHAPMRLAALSQRVLVIDEVHSYDSYTSRLIETLLTFQGAMGGSAILLTATMTGELRRRLVSSFARGAGWEAAKSPLATTAFPLVTVATEQGVGEHGLISSRGTRRDLEVRRIASAEEAVAYLAAQHSQGRAAVWIRNAVHDVLEAHALLAAAVGAANVELFHARFALGDRIDRETLVLETFGKRPSRDRNRILIASQVVEQSLDLDFDVMVTDLAPIDLVIQRAGRLHRHDRGERPGPELCVLAPDPDADVGATWYGAFFSKGQYVYPNHGHLWLTMRELLKNGLALQSRSPREPIEAVFGGDAEMPEGLRAISDRAEGKGLGQRGQASLNALQLKDGYTPTAGAWASDQETPTRLGAKQRTLRLARWMNGALEPWCAAEDRNRAWLLSEVRVLASRVAEIELPDAASQAACDREAADWPDRYDPPVLVPLVEAEPGTWRATARGEGGDRIALLYSSKSGLTLAPLPAPRPA